VDKSILGVKLAEANALTKTKYTAESWEMFVYTRNAAQAVYDNNSATQEQVDMAVSNLIQGMARLVVNSRVTVTVTANSLTIPYNGFMRSIDGYTVKWSDGNKAGAVLSGLSVPTVSMALPGTTPVTFSGTGKITIGAEDVTADYNIVTVDGVLEVSPLIDRRIKVTVTANSGEFSFDGTEKSVDGYTIEWPNSDLAYLQLLGLSANATRTEPGTTAISVTGTPVIILEGMDVTPAFNIIRIPGTLTINEKAEVIEYSTVKDPDLWAELQENALINRENALFDWDYASVDQEYALVEQEYE
jgi:hypothetical protein